MRNENGRKKAHEQIPVEEVKELVQITYFCILTNYYMKKLFFLFLFAPFTFFAQNDSSYFDMGVNVFKLLPIPTLEDPARDFVGPYMLHMEAGLGKVGIRLGLGYYKNSDTELPSATNGNTEFDNDTLSTDIRFGLSVRSAIGKKWSLKYGADFVLGKRNRAFNTVLQDQNQIQSNVETEYDQSASGLGLFIFPQYHISPRVSIATELQFLLLSTKTTETLTNSTFPDFNSEISRTGSLQYLFPPASLYLLIRF